MFIDIIRYKLAAGIDEPTLRRAAKDIVEVWMKKQDGFLRWEINKSEKGYVDFVYWRDKAAADKANQNMKDIPTDHPWMKCYDMGSIAAEKAENLDSFLGES